MSKWSSFKEQQKLHEGWRRFLNEGVLGDNQQQETVRGVIDHVLAMRGANNGVGVNLKTILNWITEPGSVGEYQRLGAKNNWMADPRWKDTVWSIMKDYILYASDSPYEAKTFSEMNRNATEEEWKEIVASFKGSGVQKLNDIDSWWVTRKG